MHIAHTAFGFLVKMPETAQTLMTLAYFPAVFLILIKGQSATNTVYKHFGAHWIGWDIALVYQAICARQKHQVDKWQDLFYYLFSHANFIMEGHNNSYLFELKGIRTTKVNCTENIKQSWLDWLRIVLILYLWWLLMLQSLFDFQIRHRAFSVQPWFICYGAQFIRQTKMFSQEIRESRVCKLRVCEKSPRRLLRNVSDHCGQSSKYGPTVWVHCVWNCKYLTLMILAWQFLISSAPKCFHPCLQSRFGFARKGKIVWTYLQSHLMRDMFWIHWTTHHLRYALANMTQRKKTINWAAFGFVLESVSIFKHGKYQGMSGEADEGRRMPSRGKNIFHPFCS